jgi:hypothetical protein
MLTPSIIHHYAAGIPFPSSLNAVCAESLRIANEASGNVHQMAMANVRLKKEKGIDTKKSSGTARVRLLARMNCSSRRWSIRRWHQ